MNAPVEGISLAECPHCVEQNTPIKSLTSTTENIIHDIIERPDGTFIANHINFEIGRGITLSSIDRKISLSTKEYVHSYNLKGENSEASKIEIRFQPYNSKDCIINVQGKEYSLKTNHELFKKLSEKVTLPVYTETKEGGVRLIAIQ